MQTYTVFKRSARNFEEFANAKKLVLETGLSLKDARQACKDFNDNRTGPEVDAGTKLEFEGE